MSYSTLDMKSSNSFATNGGPLWPDNTHMTGTHVLNVFARVILDIPR